MTHKVKSILVSGFASIALMLSAEVATAQMPAQAPQMQVADATSYNDEELKQFAEATKEVQKVQMEMQQKMVTAIQEEGLDPMQFQKMAQAQQSGAETADTEYTEEEQQAYANAMKAVMTMQQEVQAEMQTKLEDQGMTMQEYQMMAMAIQQSPEVTEKVKTLIQGS